jgi:hypothetical protein
MMLAPVVRTRLRSSAGVATSVAFIVMLAACATHSGGGTAASTSRPEALTVSQLKSMLSEGEAIGVILGRIDESGTVYRLTSEQWMKLSDAGMPGAILSKMQLTYDEAIRRHPDLAKSDQQWIKIGNYWYGGLPAGWPREWVFGTPPAGLGR